jgi:hypothetical protein
MDPETVGQRRCALRSSEAALKSLREFTTMGMNMLGVRIRQRIALLEDKFCFSFSYLSRSSFGTA